MDFIHIGFIGIVSYIVVMLNSRFSLIQRLEAAVRCDDS